MDGTQDHVSCEDFPTCGVAQFQNKQHCKNVKQQDSYFVVEDLCGSFGARCVHQVGLYGVADGHGEFGEVAASFIRRNLPPQFAQSPHFPPGRLGHALLESFIRTDALQREANLPLWASGACVSAVAVSPTHIVVSNCGDCRCVLAEEGGTSRDLSSDHNVESASPQEIQRVVSKGGTLTPDKRVTLPGAPGRLATTRALGDYWAKPPGPPEGHVVSGLPEIRAVARHPGQKYLILASDGVFGFMSSQDVVTLCISASMLQRHTDRPPLSRVAHTVLGTAVSARRSDDNCTCLVIDLMRVPTLAAAPSIRPDVECREGMQVPIVASPLSPVDRGAPGFPHSTPHVSPSASAWPPSSPFAQSGREVREPLDEELLWCPWCWKTNADGDAENITVGSFEEWRGHMHHDHSEKLGGQIYGTTEVVPCFWCCRPCATKDGQRKAGNRLPLNVSHERVCHDNPSRQQQADHGGTSSYGCSSPENYSLEGNGQWFNGEGVRMNEHSPLLKQRGGHMEGRPRAL